jgi:hypothetical protein
MTAAGQEPSHRLRQQDERSSRLWQPSATTPDLWPWSRPTRKALSRPGGISGRPRPHWLPRFPRRMTHQASLVAALEADLTQAAGAEPRRKEQRWTISDVCGVASRSSLHAKGWWSSLRMSGVTRATMRGLSTGHRASCRGGTVTARAISTASQAISCTGRGSERHACEAQTGEGHVPAEKTS